MLEAMRVEMILSGPNAENASFLSDTAAHICSVASSNVQSECLLIKGLYFVYNIR